MLITNFSGSAIDTFGANTTIDGNFLGGFVAGGGTSNAGNGIVIEEGSSNDLIGGSTAAARNIIGANALSGIVLIAGTISGGMSGTLVENNFIGVDQTGAAAIPNGVGGVLIQSGTHDNTIGGAAAGLGNVISGNTQIGVQITGAGSSNNLIAGNLIGTNSAGTGAIPNTKNGILIDTSAAANTIGGTTSGSRNVIGGNSMDGVEVSGLNTNQTLIEGNFIGTNAAGTSAIPNQNDGVLINFGRNKRPSAVQAPRRGTSSRATRSTAFRSPTLAQATIKFREITSARTCRGRSRSPTSRRACLSTTRR